MSHALLESPGFQFDSAATFQDLYHDGLYPDREPEMDRATDREFGLATVQLWRVRPEKNERRFYAMTVTLDLFGEAILVRNWGRIGTGGRLRRDVCADIVAAGAALNDLARRKRRRGYTAWNSTEAVNDGAR